MDQTKVTGRLVQARHYALLAALSTVLFVLLNSYLLLCGYGLLWKMDGVAIYYAIFVYQGKLMRSVARSLLKGVIPKIPVYSFSMGYGADTYVTMSNSLFDPFNLISPLFPTKYAEYGFYVGMLLRYIATAWTFSMYCFHRKKSPSAAMVGSLSYATCGYALMLGVLRHPKFLNYAMWIPLMLIEADKLFEGERKWWLSVLIALALAFTPLFTYMTCIMMLGYCLIKYFFSSRQRSIKDFVLLVLSFLARIFLGFAMASVVAMPVILELLSESRVTDSGTVVPTLFTLKYYLTFPGNLVGLSVSSRVLYVGLPTCFLLLVFVMCGKRFDSKERRPWLVGLVAVTVMMLIPWFGSMFNGFNYVTDRWMPTAAFCFSYIAVLCVPVLPKLDERDWKRLCVVACLLFAASACVSVIEMEWKAIFRVLPFACFLVALLCLGHLSERWVSCALSVLIIFSTAFHCVLYCSEVGSDYASEFVTMGKAWDTLALNTAANAAKEADIEEGYRYSQTAITGTSNGALALNLHGIDFCLSMYNQSVDEFRNGLEVANNKNNHRFSGNDGRLAIDLVSGAKYFVAKKASASRVPATYKKTDISLNGFRVYKTDINLPVAFSYDSALSREVYESMGPVERQESLLEACILEDATGYDVIEPSSAAKTIEYELTAEDGVLADEHSFTTSKSGRSVTLQFTGLKNSETYLRITDLNYDGKSSRETAELFGKGGPSGLRAKIKDALYTDPGSGSYVVESELGSRSMSFPLPGNNAWSGRDDWCINLGYSKEAIDTITITFNGRGVYSFDKLEVICQPVNPMIKKAQALQEGAASDISFGVDSLSATFETKKDNALGFFSIAYSDGWSATVDGQKAEVLKGNVGFIAVNLGDAGTRHVELHYRTPGLIPGAAVTAASVAALCFLSVRSRRNSKSQSEGSGKHVRAQNA